MSTAKWELVGHIAVDAGLAMICDPCYLAEDAGPHPIKAGWEAFCARLGEDYPTRVDLGSGQGVVISTGYGDGCYPVEVRRGAEGQIAEMRVRFIGRGVGR